MPRSSMTGVAPVSAAMSWSMALRRSPKPGALTAQHWKMPRSLFTTSVASASPSTSSAITSSDLPLFATPLEQRQQVLHRGQLLLVDQDVGVVELDFHLLDLRDEVRRGVALVELHALDHSTVVSSALPSSTVITPSLPTWSMASAICLPITRRRWRRSCRPARSPCCPWRGSWRREASTTFVTASAMPFLMPIGLGPPPRS